jgi:hypothetical protein
MNGFLRKITSLAALGNLVVVLAIFAAVAAAASNPDKSNGDGNSGRRDALNTDKSKTESDDKTGDRGNSEDHRRDGTGTLPNPGKPKQGETLNVDPGKGTVKVKPKTGVPVTDIRLRGGTSRTAGARWRAAR